MTDVTVFYSPKLNKWIIRKFDGLMTLGDDLRDSKPTDDEIRAEFGNVAIRRGYSVMSNKMREVLSGAQ